ncbi:sulfatase [Pontiella sulfatireligans]|uniref:Arylsulfatase n=1 Tax=Pontiella sulfatireligans TaxID=2750658 RepID=A0A6C2UT59_9BACT|nr:sulfatase [Pontiella sulfatireligans]SPS74577.1 sulfatase S1_16 [Kiritimatiellales bacterium]VGO23520.1 Arylsulfatase [Pontiella sulfatireligans]
MMKHMKQLTLWTLCGIVSASGLAAQTKPNIVMIYIDDWAWNGSPIAMNESMANSKMPALQMPNLEKLAKQGMKFTHAYGSPQCAPARVSLQTGQSCPHSGYTVVLGKVKDEYYDMRPEYSKMPMLPNVSDTQLDEEATTIAEALQPMGYVSAHLGKWHMYSDPGKHGYAVHDGETTNSEGNTLTTGLKKGEPKPKYLPKDLSDPKLMFSITDKAMDFMEDQVQAGKPFYCQISHYAMHSGRECLDVTRQKYLKDPLVQAWYKKNNQDPEKITRKNCPANWLAMGEDLDGRIGAVVDKLKALGVYDNTYIVVVSDNGYRHEELQLQPGMKQPLHARKWWAWNGGIRVPMIVKGPGIKSGSVFNGNVVNYDFLPTFYDWAGGDPSTLQDIDGVSLVDYMKGKKPDEDFLNRNLYFHYPHYREAVPHSAIVSGSYKVMHFYERPDIPMLFDLSQDPGEVSNIAKQNPETHNRLFGEMMDYLKEVGARFPKENSNYDPAAYKKDKNTDKRLLWGPFEGQRPLEQDEI